ncbi:MAG TPA: outer membrane beta-barrel protein [Candidatus Acidoferrum sp.]|nr:outer membrane beta-barrel protein [Candidatus Acidoferrum sp.]
MRIQFALVLLTALLTSLPVRAQNGHSEVAANFSGNFQSTSAGQNVTDSPTYTGGILVNYRFHFNDWAAVEVNYARSRYTQFYAGAGGIITSWTQANAQELSMALVAKLGSRMNGRLQPFVEAGTGGLFWSPVSSGSVGGPFSQDRAALLYGGGFDWKAFGHFSLRAGYRGLVFVAPDFNQAGQFTNARTQLKEPYAGISFRF